MRARRGDYAAPDADLLAQNRMAAGIYLTCQGLPFMQGGEEFARTKHGDHNTYRGPLELNRWIGRAPPNWRSWCSIITGCWKFARRIRNFPV